MDNNVIFSFPDQVMAKLFLEWLSSGEGEEMLEQWAEDYTGYHVNIAHQPSRQTIHIGYAGRIVDDDDPEMNA